MKASAPGKLVLLGDYAVLEGATALVAAVDRRAVAEPAGADAPRSPVVEAVFRRAAARGALAHPGVSIDTSRFRTSVPGSDGRKLGFGSSAAAAVVAAAIATGRGDEECLELAIEGHRDAAGGVGSGVDVAASFTGGVIACARQPSPIRPLPSRMRGLHLSVLDTRTSASTPDLVRACKGSPRWGAWVRAMAPLADEGIAAWEMGEVARFLSVVRSYGRAMAQLGKDAGVSVVTEVTERIMREAESGGGAAKPSGAGGGDVVLVFSPDPDLGGRVAQSTGAELVEVEVAATGLHLEP